MNVFLLFVGLFAAMTTATVMITSETPRHDDQSPLVLSCNDRDSTITTPSCSFHVVEGESTFRVCSHDINTGNGPVQKCWLVSMTVEALPDSVHAHDTMGEDRHSPKQDVIRQNYHVEQSKTIESVQIVEDTSGIEIGTKAPSDRSSSERGTPQATIPQTDGKQEQRSTVTEPVEDIVQIGEYTYRPPYRGFGAKIQNLLRHSLFDDVNEEARWLHSLGIAFQRRADESLAINLPSNVKVVDDLVKRAAAAF